MDIEGQIIQFMSPFENVVGVMIDGRWRDVQTDNGENIAFKGMMTRMELI